MTKNNLNETGTTTNQMLAFCSGLNDSSVVLKKWTRLFSSTIDQTSLFLNFPAHPPYSCFLPPSFLPLPTLTPFPPSSTPLTPFPPASMPLPSFLFPLYLFPPSLFLPFTPASFPLLPPASFPCTFSLSPLSLPLKPLSPVPFHPFFCLISFWYFWLFL